MRTIPDIINIAKVSEYLFLTSNNLGGLYSSGIDIELPYKIYNVRRNVEWAYKNQPSVPTTQQKNEIAKSANYLYALCIRLALKAEEIVNKANTLTMRWSYLEAIYEWLKYNGISGNVHDVNVWNQAFDLPANGTPFSSVDIVSLGEHGYIIILSNFGTINVKANLFSSNYYIYSFVDTGCVLNINDNAFGGCTNLVDLELPICENIGYGSFVSCFSLKNYLATSRTLSLPKAKTLGYGAFIECYPIYNLDLPLVTDIGYECFSLCDHLQNIYIPSCTNLGGSVGDDQVFNLAGEYRGNITLTVPSALMTCNSGQPDGDIQYLQTRGTVTIIQV